MLHQRSGYRVFYNSLRHHRRTCETSDTRVAHEERQDAALPGRQRHAGGPVEASLAARGDGEPRRLLPVASDTEHRATGSAPRRADVGGPPATSSTRPPPARSSRRCPRRVKRAQERHGSTSPTRSTSSTKGERSRILCRTLGPDGDLLPHARRSHRARDVHRHPAPTRRLTDGLVVHRRRPAPTASTSAWRRARAAGASSGSRPRRTAIGPGRSNSDPPTTPDLSRTPTAWLSSDQAVGVAGSRPWRRERLRALYSDGPERRHRRARPVGRHAVHPPGTWSSPVKVARRHRRHGRSAPTSTPTRPSHGGGKVLGRRASIRETGDPRYEGAVHYAELSLP